MNADDPRHGTPAGEQVHRRAGERPCPPCSQANAADQRRRRHARGHPTQGGLTNARGATRRLQALFALGWSGVRISAVTGIDPGNQWDILNGTPHVTRRTAARIARAYAQLCMTLPPETTKGERVSAAGTRAVAARHGWAPPLAWDDIDTDERPTGRRTTYRADYDGRDIVDEAVVVRILAGEVLHANYLERLETMRRWLAWGRSEASLCARMAWKDGRYTPRDNDEEGAA